jgi:1,4-dihydroxy-2-naphthoate octaprenyltransferase
MNEGQPSLSWKNLRLFIRLSRPLFLGGGILLFGLGASIAGYLGRPIDLGRYLVGQLMVSLIQMMSQYLNEYFDSPADERNLSRTFLTGGSGAIGSEGLPRNVALYAAVISLALATTVATAALITGTLPVAAWPILLLAFLGGFFYSAPPLRLVGSGYGELVAALVVGGLTPTFGFVVQTGEFHRLLLMSTTPLIALGFAMLLAFELPDYGTDVKHEKRNLMVRIGWSTAMRVHDLAVLFALASFAVAFLFGLPRRVSLGTLIIVPLAVAQIWQMRRIRQGFPPRWNSLTLSAMALFAITAYIELAGYLLS